MNKSKAICQKHVIFFLSFSIIYSKVVYSICLKITIMAPHNIYFFGMIGPYGRSMPIYLSN